MDYKEPEIPKQSDDDDMADNQMDQIPEPAGFVPFKGAGNRLDGKRKKESSVSEVSPAKPVYVRGIPDYEYEIGNLRFVH